MIDNIKELNYIAELAYEDPQLASKRLNKLVVEHDFIYLKDAVFTHVNWLKLKPSRVGRPVK